MAAAPTDDGIDALHLSETHATAGGGLPLDAQQAEAIIADLATPPEQTYSVEPVRVRSPPPSRRRSLPTAAQSGVAKLRDPAYGDGSPTKVMGESGPGSAKEGAMANHGSYNGDDTASPVSKDGNVAIVVGGRRFIVDPKIFASEPDSFLGRMFGSISTGNDQPIITPNRNGDYIVGHTGGFSAQCFRAVLDYYKRGEICCPPNVSVTELKEVRWASSFLVASRPAHYHHLSHFNISYKRTVCSITDTAGDVAFYILARWFMFGGIGSCRHAIFFWYLSRTSRSSATRSERCFTSSQTRGLRHNLTSF